VVFRNVDGRTFDLDIDTHTVIKDDIGKRQLYSFDCRSCPMTPPVVHEWRG
jgi:hypothetical protein